MDTKSQIVSHAATKGPPGGANAGDLDYLRIEPLTQENLPAAIRLCETAFNRPRSEEFSRWRYRDCPSQAGFLALRNSEYVAMVWGFLRPYQIGPRIIQCIEPTDWFCVPDLRHLGAGTPVMKALMNRPEPLIAVGGSRRAISLFQKMQWQRIATAATFVLHLGGSSLARSLHNRLKVPSAIGRPLFRTALRFVTHPKSRSSPPTGRVTVVPEIGPEILRLYSTAAPVGAMPLPDIALLRWLTRGCSSLAQHFIPLYFLLDGNLCGWSLVRVYETANGQMPP